eukprot:GHUV01005499.1.p1 GENE.GHUV01005499.1~~GHUV01005499.1.p1  ORF type:complete len:349 (+),score=110.14 GHUV01005499.1:2626-3672(+)
MGQLKKGIGKALRRQLQKLGVCASSSGSMTRFSITRLSRQPSYQEGGYADLPRDLLAQVVASFANKEEARVMRGVCRSWRDVFDSTVKCIAVHSSVLLLPKQVHSFVNLQHLVISHTNTAAAQAVVEILALPSPTLTILEISHNTLNAVPHDLHQLTALRTLVLTGNRIKSIKGSYVHLLPCLEHLDLSSNMLTDLPACIGSLGGTLRKLNVSDNQLSYLPEGLGGLTALRMLRASNNCLLELPDALATLQKLTCLDLSLNRLKGVPDNLTQLTNLQQLSLFGGFSHSARNEGSSTVKVLAQLCMRAPGMSLHAEEVILQLVKIRKRQLKQIEEAARARRGESPEQAD